jgi:hypothetical protein
MAGSDNRAAIRDAQEKVRYEGLISPYACTPETHRGAPDAKAILVMSKLKNGDFVPFKP